MNIGQVTDFRIRVYSSLTATNFFEFVNPSLESYDYDADKLIDDDFFSFEAKKFRLDFYSWADELGSYLKNLMSSSDFIVRHYPQYKTQDIIIPDEETQFIDSRFDILVNGELIFVGVPDYNSYNEDIKTGKISFELVSLYGLFFDNINNIDDIRAFLDYLCSKQYGLISYNYRPEIFLQDFVDFYLKNGIDVSSLINANTDYMNEGAVVLTNPVPYYWNREEITYNWFEEATVDTFSGIKYLLKIEKSSDNKKIIVTYYEQTSNENNKINITVNPPEDSTQNATNYIYLKRICLARRTVLTFDYTTLKILKVEENKTNNSFLDFMDKGKNKNFANYVKYKNSEAYIILPNKDNNGNYWTQSKIEEDIINKLPLSVDDVAQEYTQDNIFYNGEFLGQLVISTFQKKVSVVGGVEPFVKFHTHKSGENVYIIKNDTDGLFNSEQTKSVDMFKYLLILSGNYAKFDNYSIKLIGKENIFNPTVSGEINSEKIIKLNSTQTILNIVKDFEQANYSETDNHFFIKLFVFEYKFILSRFQKNYSCEVIKEVGDKFEFGQKVYTRIGTEDFYFIVNSVSKNESTFLLELIRVWAKWLKNTLTYYI